MFQFIQYLQHLWSSKLWFGTTGGWEALNSILILLISRPGVLDEILKGLTIQPMQEVDHFFTEDVSSTKDQAQDG